MPGRARFRPSRSRRESFFHPSPTWSTIMRHLLLTGVTAFAATVCVASFARTDDQKTADVKFVKDANQINLEEVQVGKLAQQHSSNPAIKKFAQDLAQDHATMSQELTAVARK